MNQIWFTFGSDKVMFHYMCSNTHAKQKKATTDSDKNRTYVTFTFRAFDLYESTTYWFKQIVKCNTKPFKIIWFDPQILFTYTCKQNEHQLFIITIFRGKNPYFYWYILTNAVNGGSVRIRAPMYTGSIEDVTTSTTFRWTSMDTSNRIPRCITTYALKLDTWTPTKHKHFCFHQILRSNFFMKTKNAKCK